MADNCKKVKDPRAIRRNSEESSYTNKGVNGDDERNKTAKSSSKRNYKLLIDPAIKKGHQKIYRFDGVFPGQPPVVLRDPRPPRTKLWTATVADLPIPRFKVDKYYVGALPENTIRFGCLNDNINRQFLRELCSKFGKIEECKVYYDIKSKKHLGTGKIAFSTPSAARQAVSELDGSSVMGNIIRVSIERKKSSQAKPGQKPGNRTKDPREFRDPRRSNSVGSSQTVLPTPSPSQHSPSVESTPPTPLISSMNRAQPVANIRPGVFNRRGSSMDNDVTPLESPASICSASFNSTTFEPVSPPPVARFRPSSNDCVSLPPPPPPDKASNLPPPPPPSKQEIYEDISPTANFDDDAKSPTGDKLREKGVDRGNETFVQAHLLGLKIARGVENTATAGKRDFTVGNSEAHRHPELNHHKGHHRSPDRDNDKGSCHSKQDDEQFPSSRNDRPDLVAERTLSRSNSPIHSHVTKNRAPGIGRSLGSGKSSSRSPLTASPKCNDKNFESRVNSRTQKPQSESVYEAISDSDDDDKEKRIEVGDFSAKNLQVEDISPANSPVTRNPVNGISHCKPLPATNDALEASSVVSQKENAHDENEMEIDDDDDAMSLSSISSNEESALVLNTPVNRIQVQVPTASSSAVSFNPFSSPAVFATTRPSMNIARPPGHPANVVVQPPVNMPAPPRVNVAPPPQMNMPPANVHQPPMNVQQTPMITRLPPPPPVNIHVPPPGHPFNQNIPQQRSQQQHRLPPYGHPPGQPPPVRPSQPPLASYPQRSVTGGFLGSYSRPYSGFFPGNYQNYPEYNQGRPTSEVVKEIPYEEKVKNSCILKTKKDLKLVLHRDLIKRLVEHSGFAALEAWWDNQTKKKDSSSASRSASLAHQYASPLTQSHAESPSSSTTSSLLKSLFGPSHQPLLSSSLSSPTSNHPAVTKIPSFRINRIPQARPVVREPASKRFKREGQGSGYEIANKVRRVEELSDEERTVREEESESESDSEVERTLLASRRSAVKSGSSLYQSIYKSSSEGEDPEDEQKSVESEEDEEDDDDKFQDLVDQQKRLKKGLSIEKKIEDDLLSVEDDDAVSEDEEDEEEEKEEDESEDEDEQSTDEESDSEWESSGAEEAVQDVIKETERRLEHFKEKSSKKQVQESKLLEHERLMTEYLKRRNDHVKRGRTSTQEKNNIIERDLIGDKENENSYYNKIEKIEPDLEFFDEGKEVAKIDQHDDDKFREEKSKKENKMENYSEVVEETIEETQILSKLSDLETSGIKEELISEEIIEEIEPEEGETNKEVLNEHSYAFKSSFDNQIIKEEKEKSLSPVIDVVDMIDMIEDKEFFKKEPEPKPVFPMRSIEEENSIVWNLLRFGIDNEDLKYVKSAFESLHVFGSNVVKDLHWSHHPETVIQTKQKRSKGEGMLRVHKTGSARSEGYYKIPYSEKAQYLSSVMRHLEAMDENVEKEADGLKHKQQSRDHRAMQRRLVSSFVNDDFGDLVKFNKLKTRKKRLKFAKSGIHNWGLFTCEPIAAEEMVIEYVGEIVRSVIADSREKNYEQRGIGSSYMFRLDAETVIDATKVGNNARFINHSCTPNCYAKIINVENEKKIVIYSKGDIKLNDEITYDYKFPIEEEKIECLCGAPQCRGTLN